MSTFAPWKEGNAFNQASPSAQYRRVDLAAPMMQVKVFREMPSVAEVLAHDLIAWAYLLQGSHGKVVVHANEFVRVVGDGEESQSHVEENLLVVGGSFGSGLAIAAAPLSNCLAAAMVERIRHREPPLFPVIRPTASRFS